MKLLTKEIMRKLPRIGATDGKDKRECYVVKFFTPDSSWTWWAVEGQPFGDNDYRFFGLVQGHETEWGYFLLSQLQEVRGAFGLAIERDRFYSQEAWKRDLDRLGMNF